MGMGQEREREEKGREKNEGEREGGSRGTRVGGKEVRKGREPEDFRRDKGREGGREIGKTGRSIKLSETQNYSITGACGGLMTQARGMLGH